MCVGDVERLAVVAERQAFGAVAERRTFGQADVDAFNFAVASGVDNLDAVAVGVYNVETCARGI